MKKIFLPFAVVVCLLQVGCVPFIAIEIQNTQRTASDASDLQDKFHSPIQGSERVQYKPISNSLETSK